jgi:membrane carboxypeptidase/penicillin-binding protein
MMPSSPALAGAEGEDFAVPPGVEFRKVDRLNGLLATENCPDTIDEAYLEGTAPVQVCPLHPGSEPAEPVGARPGRGKGIFHRLLDLFR